MNIIKLFRKNQLLSGTLIVTVGSFLGSVFSYLLQLFLGRNLTVAQYGLFNALLSLSVIISVFNGALSTSLIKAVSELKAHEHYGVITKLFRQLSLLALAGGMVFFLLILLFRHSFAKFLHTGESTLFIIFGVYIGITLLGIIAPAFLQGLLRFKAYAFWLVLTSVLRFLFPVLLVFVGFEVKGVFLGIAFSVICSYLAAAFLLRRDFQEGFTDKLHRYYKKILIFAGPVLFVHLGLTILNNADVVLVKHYFDADLAGIYSGTVTLGKILLFGAGTVGVVMYPQIAAAYARKEDYYAKIKPFLLLQTAVVVLGLVAFVFFPKVLTLTMFGSRYLDSVEYLPGFSVFIAFYILANFLTLFFLAIEKVKVFVLHISAVILQLVLIATYHADLNQVIFMNVAVSGLLLLSLVGYFFNSRSRVGASHTT